MEIKDTTKQNKEGELIPPLTFRLYQSIRFNRPVNKETDIVSPGGYELKMKDSDCSEKVIKFDFEDYEGSIDKDNPHIVHCMQKNPDYNTFEDLNKVTEHMLRNVTEVIEWFIFTGEPCDTDNPLIPVEVTNVYFEIISDASARDIGIRHIIMPIPIDPESNFLHT